MIQETHLQVEDILEADRVDTASGDLGRQQLDATCRAIWTRPIEGERGAPEQRIIHARYVAVHEPVRLKRIGVKPAIGYHKCGSHDDVDWVVDFRVLVWDGNNWSVLWREQGLGRPRSAGPQWFDLGYAKAQSVIIEVRKCGIDEWWTGWNLASDAFVLEATPSNPMSRKENRYRVEVDKAASLPAGVESVIENGEVRFKSRFLQVGFMLGRTGLSFLGLDEAGGGNVQNNLLRLRPAMNLHGLRLHPIGAEPVSGLYIRHDLEGTTRVAGNRVVYETHSSAFGISWRLEWEILEEEIRLNVRRSAARPIAAWESSVWTMSLNSEVAAACLLAPLVKSGETGLTGAPALLHFPTFGSLRVEASRNVSLRSDSFRSFRMTTLELKLDEQPRDTGDYWIPGGETAGSVSFKVAPVTQRLRVDTPVPVQRAVERAMITSMTYRPDTATLSNNGNSIHCPICMDNWSGMARRIGDVSPGFNAMELVRESLERWLNDAPGYASGRMVRGDGFHMAEDEYIMTGTAAVLGLAEYLVHSGTSAWTARFANQIRRKLNRMRERDLDGDGLVESPYRLGNSGEFHWSTCWWDVISFGWKDAFANAILYDALRKLPDVLADLGQPVIADGLGEWADRLAGSYSATFLNEKTGWLGGWMSKDGVLHDHAFLFVNGAAINAGLVDDDRARGMMEKLIEEMGRVGLEHARYGLPGNLWKIPDDDMVKIMHGVSFGFYQNGGLTHSQSRHFVEALYRVGLTGEADRLLEELCGGFADGTCYGGINSGVDWRYWDGAPCGYEGLLTDQFGILGVAVDRWGCF